MEMVKIKGVEAPISRLAMGTSWFEQSKQRDIDELLEAYYEAGGTMLDTGRFYNGTKTEKFLADWLNRTGMRGKTQFTCKGGHYFVNDNNEHFPEVSRVTPKDIIDDLHFSLNHLGLDHFEVFMLHRDNVDVPVDELVDCLEEHHNKGEIGAYGLSNWTLPRVKLAMEYAKKKGYQGITAVSPSYSLATVHTARWHGCEYVNDEYAAFFKGTDATILSWGSQGGGYFTESWTRENAPVGYVQCYFNDENAEKLKRAKELAKAKGCQPVNISLSYILSQGLPIVPIIGPRNKEEFKVNLKSLDIKLTPQEVEYMSLRSNTL
ncbi:aldo/keto reductase [Desulfovibrio sp. OttesenSCG-928-C06]|nr:aldo/keto reductase [Desulfovibrio sp. OttesenSCG-928-C06]